jgi:hypothetical protein
MKPHELFDLILNSPTLSDRVLLWGEKNGILVGDERLSDPVLAVLAGSDRKTLNRWRRRESPMPASAWRVLCCAAKIDMVEVGAEAE